MLSKFYSVEKNIGPLIFLEQSVESTTNHSLLLKINLGLECLGITIAWKHCEIFVNFRKS